MHSTLNIVSLLSMILITIAVSVTEAGPRPCARNACKKIRCDPLESIREKCLTKKGIFQEKGGWCQCCPFCLKRLYEDQNCSVSPNLQLPVRAKCSEGLQCDTKYRRCVRIVNKSKDVDTSNYNVSSTNTTTDLLETTTTTTTITNLP